MKSDPSDDSTTNEKNIITNSDPTPDNQVSDVELRELLTQSETWPVGLTNRRQIEWAKSIVCSYPQISLADYILRLMWLKEKTIADQYKPTEFSLSKYIETAVCLATGTHTSVNGNIFY